MPELSDKTLYFQASDVQAIFADGSEVAFSDHGIHVTTSPAGEHVLHLGQEGDSSHDIRLYLTTPDSDWRRNVSYAWQLSMAMMKVPGVSTNDNKPGWLYWNTENNINSDIKVDNSTSFFSAESITFHFQEMSRIQRGAPPKTKLTIQNMLLGAYLLPRHDRHDPLANRDLYRPCQSPVCDITDGVVSSMGQLPAVPTATLPEGIPLYAAVAAIVAVLCLIVLGVVRCTRRQILAQKYARIADDSDLKMDEDTGDETTNR